MLPKLLLIASLLVFGLIGIFAIFKGRPASTQIATAHPIEVKVEETSHTLSPAFKQAPVAILEQEYSPAMSPVALSTEQRIDELFNTHGTLLPIVETISYKSHVPWLKGRPAWLSDYATHYETSRHFIARSLNGKPDYLKQELVEGNKFNVFRKDKNFEFHLVVATNCCQMRFYYKDLDTKDTVLLKTYQVGLGRLDASKASGILTPLGTYKLGNRIAIYKPQVMGIYQGKKIEMLTVFGTRWIPFEKEIAGCTASAKGFGIHGTPWSQEGKEWKDHITSIGHYESDGCIRLATPDMEEIFAIIITKPTMIEIVRDFKESALAERE